MFVLEFPPIRTYTAINIKHNAVVNLIYSDTFCIVKHCQFYYFYKSAAVKLSEFWGLLYDYDTRCTQGL